MGQQQILLIVLSVILVGVAVAIGISMFRDNAINSNRDAIYSDLNNIAANVYKFRMTPTSMGGGGGSYTGLNADEWKYLGSIISDGNENASYAPTLDGPDGVTVIATGKQGSDPWVITCVIDQNGGTTYTATGGTY